MATLRNISADTLDVRAFGQTVEPDGLLEVSDALWAQHEWPETVWAEVQVPRRVFDPSEHTVAQVLAHLDKADDDERDRVLAAERAGKARAGVLGNDEQ
jgi:hypothetical protein